MQKTINSVIKIFEEFERSETTLNPNMKYAEQLPSESEDFAAYREAHEGFNRAQRLRAFLSDNPDLTEELAYSLLENENVINGLDVVVCNKLQKILSNLTVRSCIKI